MEAATAFYTFSFFRAPVRNALPAVAFSILDAYRYLVSPIAKERTERLRAMGATGEAGRFKAQGFDIFTYHDDTLLMFTSPSGNGVKWVVEADLQDWEHSRYFKSVANCCKATGLPDIDRSGSDVARACFLPYDPEAFIHPKYKEYADQEVYTPAVGNLLR